MPFPTISYPSPTNSNPAPDSEGFASAATNAYSAGLQHATALRYAAQQDQKQKQDAAAKEKQNQLKQDADYQKELLDIRKMGGTDEPGSDGPTIFHQDATLQRPQGADFTPDPAAAPQHPLHTFIDSRGKAHHIPDASELAQSKKVPPTPLDDTNSFVPTGDLGKELEAAGWQSGQRITPANLHLMLESAHGGNTAEFFHTTDADGATHVYVQDKKNGSVKEVGNFPDSSKGTADKADATQLIPGMLGPSGGPLLLNKKTGGADEVQVPKGSKRAMTPGQEAAAGRSADARADRQERAAQAEADRQERLNRTAQSDHDRAYNAEQAQWELVKGYEAATTHKDEKGQVRGGNPADTVIDPKTGKEEVNSPAIQENFAALAKSARIKAAQFAKQSDLIRKQKQWGDYSPEKKQQQAEAPAPAAADPQAAPPPAAAPVAKPLEPWNRLAKPPAAAPAKKMRVKLSNGKVGTIDPGDFDAKTMTQLGN